MSLRKTPEDYHQLATTHGIEWLGSECRSVYEKTQWRCPYGHTWAASYQSVRHCTDTGCPFCSGHAPKTPEDYQALAKSRGFKWLGPEVSQTREKTRWQCPNSHIWEAAYFNIRNGSGCPFCANQAPKTTQDYHNLALKRGFKWLGPEVKTVFAKTEWECSKGHRWMSRYNNIYSGYGCPHCVEYVNGTATSRVQCRLQEMIGGELNHPVGRYHLDIALFIDGVKIDVEYDCWYWHHLSPGRDFKRDKALGRQGWRILRVKSGELLPSKRQLDTAIAQLVAGKLYTEIVLKDWGG